MCEEMTELRVRKCMHFRIWSLDGKVAPHFWKRLKLDVRNLSDSWLPTICSVLRSDAHCDDMAVRLGKRIDCRCIAVEVHDVLVDHRVSCKLIQITTHGHHKLERWYVTACDALGDRMLHLKSRVQLKKVELIRFLQEQVLHRSSMGVVHHKGEPSSSKLHLPHGLLWDRNRWSLFDDLLKPALHRAVPPGEDGHIPMLVAHQLDLDMACLGAQPHEKDRGTLHLIANLLVHRFDLVT
mmetsp:Transcript_32468/g.74378  ORF Transcript_32468/g.74378 Transcript_32468/m.74378 type:complete len:238 (+) Transcript_32468:5542-6255(+)